MLVGAFLVTMPGSCLVLFEYNPLNNQQKGRSGRITFCVWIVLITHFFAHPSFVPLTGMFGAGACHKRHQNGDVDGCRLFEPSVNPKFCDGCGCHR